jgi:hypothetical protein
VHQGPPCLKQDVSIQRTSREEGLRSVAGGRRRVVLG